MQFLVVVVEYQCDIAPLVPPLFRLLQFVGRCCFEYISVIVRWCSTAEGDGGGVGVGTRIDGRHAGRGCAACIVVFFDGSKAERGMVL